ncbi:type IV secretion system protein [Celeribacter halophilus]|uniref:type IV secretion system protein n=1 Tax=Celeribacter halophilus TaxID=576117 RepID=UPI001C082BBD|nr:type IV secretion system protein [Celeribacter halophilus]MBU2889084.1 type IV secretion system protein [Celeribacter halophilus]MDO6510387.1 type IV secretion system protein [Celeribacter halophilus]
MWQSIYSGFIDNTTEVAAEIASSMSGTLAAPLSAAMTLYIILYGWAVMRGSIQEPVMDFTFRAMKLLVIWTLVVKAGDYTSWAGSTITSGVPEFIDQLAGGEAGNTLPADAIFRETARIADEIQKFYVSQGVSGKITGALYYAIMMVTGGVVAAIVFAVSLLITLGLTMMAAVGPLFIAFALFDFSRGWFFSWLAQILNFGVLKLLTYVLGLVLIAMLQEAISETATLSARLRMFFFFGMLAASFVMFFLLPSIAAALSAGAQASTGMAQRWTERKLGLLSNKNGGGGPSGTSAGSASRR